MSDTARRALYLDAMGVSRWLPRDAAPEEPVMTEARSGTGEPAARTPAVAGGDPAADLEALASEVAGCTACGLCEGRTQTVFGVGDPAADWMIVGEGPGEKEDLKGEPFVGPAGQLLDNMLRAAGRRRGDGVYIANMVKCRPPDNRNPRPEEVAACFGYLKRQVAIIRPRLIIAVGRVAAQNLLGTDAPLGRMRGRVYQMPDHDIPVIVTYHPAYLLRKPQDKRQAWADLRFALGVTREAAA